MSTLKKELAKILAIKDDSVCREAFERFCLKHKDELPLPGEDTLFDKVVWAASQFMPISGKDEDLVKKVTARLLGEQANVIAQGAVKLKDLMGSAKEAAIAAWQDMLLGLHWQQMVPAGALRGVDTQMISLGTFQRQLSQANIKLNLGWIVDEDELRILLQAKDQKDEALSDVELRIKEADRGVVFSRKTNQDGTVVAPCVKVGPGKYQLEVEWGSEIAETPYFVI